MQVPYCVMTHEVEAALPSSLEKRKTARHALAVAARMLGHDAIPHAIRITDISRGGIGLVAQTELQAGDTCAIAFDATVDDEARRINVWAKVAYCLPLAGAAFRIGVHFRDYDTHSRTHIEQLCGMSGLPVGW